MIAALANQMNKYIAIILMLMTSEACSNHEPWIEDEYFFYKQGEVRSYTFTPKRFVRPEIVIYDSDCILPKDLFLANRDGTKVDKLNWEVLIEVLRKEKIIESQNLKLRAGFLGDEKCYKSLSFNQLKSISWKLFPKKVTVRLTVHSIDSRFSQPDERLSFGIRHSPVP